MSYQNQYVEEDSIHMNELLRVREKYVGTTTFDSHFEKCWVYDESIDSFLYFVCSLKTDEQTGLIVEPTNRKLFLFYFEGESEIVELIRDNSSSSNFSDSPFYIRWDFPNSYKYSCRLLESLKHALIVYGHKGIRKQVTNTQVEFKF